MNAIIGIVVLMICVFGGFIMAGGSMKPIIKAAPVETCLLYTSPSPRDRQKSRMPSSA